MYSYDMLKKMWTKESSYQLIPGDLGKLGPKFQFSHTFYPRSRIYAAVDYDPLESCIILFGGFYQDSIYRKTLQTYLTFSVF